MCFLYPLWKGLGRRLLLTPLLSLLLLTSRAASQSFAGLPALDQPITLDVQGETLRQVLHRIEEQTDVHFSYSRERIGSSRLVSLKAEGKPLAQVLDEFLMPLNIQYEIIKGDIVLSPAHIQGPIRGRVRDAQGNPIPGAAVRIEGTTLGTVTDLEGNFLLSDLPAGPFVLLFSSIGYTPFRQEIKEGQTDLSDMLITLQEDVKGLDEVVVVGYGTARRQDVTGSVATVSSRDFVQGQVTDPGRLIQGKMAGVQVTAGGGAPGEVGIIRIRGGSSLNASNDPLIVIDGVPVDNSGVAGAGNPLALLNPSDIESFTVLKDASATAIYGSRASNGVVLITTKRGAVGDKLHVTASTQVSRSANYGRVDVLTGDEFRTLAAQTFAAHPELQRSDVSLGSASTDWQKEIYQPAYTTDNSLSIMGSIARKVPFRVSGGYLNQQGTLKTGYMERYTGSVGLSPRFFDNHLRVDLNLKSTVAHFRFADQGAIGGAVRRDPTRPVYSGDTLFNGYTEWTDPSTGGPQQLTDRNPVALLNDKHDVSKVYRNIGNVQLDYSLHGLPDLHANLNLGLDYTRSSGTVDVSGKSSVAYITHGQHSRYSQSRNNKVLEFFLNYGKTLAQDHRIEALAGYSYQDFWRYSPSYFTLTDNGRPIDTTATLPLPFETQNTLVSFYGRLNYGYREKYLLTATLRDDGSSHFAPGNKWGLFPAASVAWRIGRERFLLPVKAVSELKLRASYGITGQQDIFNASGTDYPYLARYQLGGSSVMQQFGNQYVYTYRPAAYDRNLRWESTHTYNAGLDFGFFGNRLSGAVDVYLRQTSDLLAVIPVPVGTNLSDRVLTNIGSLENQGLEFTANYAILQKPRGLNWTVSFNLTHNRNKITQLTQISDSSFLGTQVNAYQINTVGYAANSFFVLHQRYDEAGKPIENADLTKMYVDVNGDGQINERDYYQYKSPAPKLILGFSSSLNYKAFSLAFTVRSNIGGYVYNNVEADRSALTSLFPAQPFYLNGVRSLGSTGFYNPQLHSDYYIQDASFVRLENITLGYDLGAHLKAVPTLRLTLAAQNVLVLTKYTGVNPEIFNGIDNNFYPLPRTFTLGLTAGI